MAKKSKKSSPKPTIKKRYTVKPWRARVLKFIAKGRSVTNAAELCGVCADAVYKAIREDPAFKDQYTRAMIESMDRLEDEVRHRAEHGVDEPVIHQGQRCFQLLTEKDEPMPIGLIDKMPTDKEGKPLMPKGWRIVPFSIRKPADSLATFILRSRRPEIYREKVQVQAEGFKEEQIVLVHTPPPE